MATKVQLAEQVKRMLSGGDSRSDSDIREIIQAVESARDSVIFQLLTSTVENAQSPSFSDTELYSQLTEKKAISAGTAYNSGYSYSIPEYLLLPEDKGLYSVTKKNNFKSSGMFVRAQGAPGFWDSVASSEGLLTYYVFSDGESPRIWIRNNVAIDIRYIPTTKNIASTTELKGGGIIDDAVVKSVYQMYVPER
jgi:hypothetical protein